MDRRNPVLHSSGCRSTVDPRSWRQQTPAASAVDRDPRCEILACPDARSPAAPQSKTSAHVRCGAVRSARELSVRDKKSKRDSHRHSNYKLFGSLTACLLRHSVFAETRCPVPLVLVSLTASMRPCLAAVLPYPLRLS